MSESKEQNLVNAQIDVNRAVFLMNEKSNGNKHQIDVSFKAICLHIRDAIQSLEMALNDYSKEGE